MEIRDMILPQGKMDKSNKKMNESHPEYAKMITESKKSHDNRGG